MTTLDFELEISPGVADSYPVVARAPGGEVSTTLRWSLTSSELDHQLAVIKDKVLTSSTVVRRMPTEDEQPVRELGQRLFEALIVDDVRSLHVARLATDGHDTARVWDASNGQELVTVIVHSVVWGVAFSPDGRRLATASEDCTARIWVLSDDE